MTKLVDVSVIQAGDVLLINKEKLTCEYVDTDGISYSVQGTNSSGQKVFKLLSAGEQVGIEL